MADPGEHSNSPFSCESFRNVQEEREGHEMRDEVNLSLPEEEDVPDQDDELMEVAFSAELVDTFDMFVDEAETEEQLGRNYAITPSSALKAQLQAYKVWRTRILNINRTSKKVEQITVEGDCKTFLR